MKRLKMYIKGIFKQRKAVVFMFFILFSLILWILIKFSDTYSDSIDFDVKYINVPKDKILLGTPPEKLSVTIQGQGFQILSYRLFTRELELDVSKIQKGISRYYLSKDYLESAIKEVLAKNINLQKLNEDTLYLDFGINKQKVVPVVHRVTANFATDYDFYDSLTVTPSEIEIWGPEDIVDSVSYLETEEVFLNKVDDDINIPVAIIIPKELQQLRFNERGVDVKGKVERFSERLIEVPLIVTNMPQGTVVRVFPKQVRVLFKAALSDITSIKVEDFMIVCDFNKVNSSSDYLIPQILKKPAIIKEAHLLDKKVEYLIKRE